MIIAIATLTLTSCGRSSDDYESNEATTGNGPSPRDVETFTPDDVNVNQNLMDPIDSYQLGDLTLTIYTVYPFADATAAMAREFVATIRPEATIDVITLNPHGRSVDWAVIEHDLRTQLAAGTAPDLINHQLLGLGTDTAVYLADWFRLMEADSSFDSARFFENVFDAVAIDGLLYTFPLHFSFNYVTANDTVPGLADALEWYIQQYGGITISQVLGLFTALQAQHPMYLDWDFDVSYALFRYIYSFIDLEARSADFDNHRFTNFINLSLSATRPNKIFGRFAVRTMDSVRNIRYVPIEMEHTLSESHFFQVLPAEALQYFLEFEDRPMFIGAAPLITSRGELEISVEGYLLNANTTDGQQMLAMQFMRFATSGLGRTAAPMDGGVHLNIPVYRAELRYFLNVRVRVVWATYRSLPMGTTAFYAANSVLAQLTPILEMPMIVSRLNGIDAIINDALEDFHYGRVSAEQVAEDLQNRVTAALLAME